MGRGKFIVFEGVDSTGKTTISTMIQKWLNEIGITSVFTKHPGSTAVGLELRQILKHSPHPINANAQALLFAADNSMFINQILEPELDKGNWVIGDRNNFISSMAYQIASGCSMEELDKVHDATLQTTKIDLLFIFNCSWKETKRRKQTRGQEQRDRYEDQGKDYFDKLASCYARILEDNVRLKKFLKNPKAIYSIDANQPINRVFSAVKDGIISEFLAPPKQ